MAALRALLYTFFFLYEILDLPPSRSLSGYTAQTATQATQPSQLPTRSPPFTPTMSANAFAAPEPVNLSKDQAKGECTRVKIPLPPVVDPPIVRMTGGGCLDSATLFFPKMMDRSCHLALIGARVRTQRETTR